VGQQGDRTRARGKMSYIQAALTILAAASQPMTAREIAHEAMERGWIQSLGKRPSNNMTARLYEHFGAQDDQRLLRHGSPRRGGKNAPVRWSLRDGAAAPIKETRARAKPGGRAGADVAPATRS
jgi:hypothetical protein